VNQEAVRNARLLFSLVVLGIADCSGSGKTTLTAETILTQMSHRGGLSFLD